MLVKSLEIQGFKTFPDKTVLEFHNGITAVVGPNGSGKSNISDALRWVLGEQSTRTLRCSRMEEVIFNGTPQRKPQGYAEVTLRIDNSDRRLPFDKDELAVTRRYYRSGESEYLLNKVAVRLRDINELFMDTGLGRDGYSIIGQGKIDAIVAARSEDRREIFEEASGISRFRYRKQESERKLAAAEENLTRLRDILDELETRVGPLKAQSEKAQAFLAYAQEKKGLEIGLWLHTLSQCADAQKTHEGKMAVVRNQQAQAAQALDALDAALERNFDESNRCAAQIDRLRQDIAGLEEAAAKKDGEADVLQNDVQHCQTEVERLQAEIRSSAEDRARLETEAADKARAVQEKEAHAKDEQAQITALNEKLEALRRGMNQTAAQMDSFTSRLSALSAAATEGKVAQMAAASTIAEIGLRLDQIREDCAQREHNRAALETARQDTRAQLAQAKDKAAGLQNAVRGYELRLQTREKKWESLRQEADRLLLDAKESTRRAGLLEDLERNMEGFNRSVKVVMQEHARGTLPGVHGPVSRLIAVPQQYAVALETALGAAMQHIVVGTEEDAKRAIALLKRRDSGRATFLPLSTISGRVLQEPGLADCRGFVGIASELCSSEQAYRCIRENLLGRIAVAQDLDAAVDIARRFHYRFRVVTLDGQVVNAGGSLTGGSQARGSGLLSRRAEIARIREKAAAQQQAADRAALACKSYRAETAQGEAALSAARGDLTDAQETSLRLQAAAAQLDKEIAANSQALQKLIQERQSSAARLQEQQKLRDEAARKAGEASTQAAQLNAQLQALSGSRGELDRTGEAYAAKVQEHRMQMLADHKDCENLRAAIADIRRRQSDHAGHADVLAGQIQDAKARITMLHGSMQTVHAEAEAFRANAAEHAEQISQISARRLSLEQENTDLRRRQRDKSEEKENAGHELARLEARSEGLQQQYDEILAKLWEEYELTRREAEQVAAPIENLQQAQKRLNELKAKIRALGSVNVAAIEEFKEVNERYAFLSAQVADVEKSRAELARLILDLTRQMKEQFAQSFARIRRNFADTFRDILGGGHAELELTQPEDILHSGIEIIVQPPGKNVAHLESLSGGEKALVAISLYFAIMKVSPPPFCMLDEIEAALDDVNVARYAAYLRRMAESTQFIIITHRRGSMEEADVLYGVTMQDKGVSKILVLHPDQVDKYQ